MSFNCHSLRNKTHEVMDLLNDKYVDIGFIQETWLLESDSALIEDLKGYGYDILTKRKTRKIDRGGGLAVLYKKNLKLKSMSYKQYASFESQVVCVDTTQGKLMISNIYFPGYSTKHRFTHSMFIEDFQDFINEELNLSGPCIVLGDFNIHMEDSNRPETNAMKAVLQSCELICMPTSKTHTLGGQIDWILCSREALSLVSSIEVLYEVQISDHYPLLFKSLFEPFSGRYPVHLQYQKCTPEHIEVLRTEVLQSSTLSATKTLPLENKVHSFNAVLRNIFTDISPMISKTVQDHGGQEWYNPELRDLKREKRKAERRWLKKKDDTNEANYRIIMRKYYEAVRMAKNNFYSKILQSNKKDPKVLYNMVYKLLGEKDTKKLPASSSNKALADKFASFFNEKICRIRTQITSERELRNVTNEQNDVDGNSDVKLHTLQRVTEEEVLNIFRDMNKKYNIMDPIPIRAMKGVFGELLTYIADIINSSFSQGIFPSELKHSTVIPVIKSKNLDTEDVNNYRPISNTATLAKIVEKAALAQINDHLSANDLHTVTQSGYKKGHSCETAVLKIVNDVQNEVFKKNVAVVLMLDLSAAFDTIDQTLLIEMLRSKYGFEGKALAWVTSYLKGRTFSVKIKSSESCVQKLLYGVPQGGTKAAHYTADVLYTGAELL